MRNRLIKRRRLLILLIGILLLGQLALLLLTGEHHLSSAKVPTESPRAVRATGSDAPRPFAASTKPFAGITSDAPEPILSKVPVSPDKPRLSNRTEVAARVRSSGSVAPQTPTREPEPQMNPVPFEIVSALAGVNMGNPVERARAVEEVRRRETAYEAAVAAKAAGLGLPIYSTNAEGQLVRLAGFLGDEPVFHTPLNIRAAITSATDGVWSAPYNLTGSGVKVGVWDVGGVRTTHREFKTNRVVMRDSGSVLADHPTHVVGTIAARGSSNLAKGMAPAALVDAYNTANYFTEMAAAGAATAGDDPTDKIPISNHSYASLSIATNTVGVYESGAMNSDAMARSLPYYLQFWAAGNSQDKLTFKGGYLTIAGVQIAKNIMTVGATEDGVVTNSPGEYSRYLPNATMSTFSSWGPADDGRIKPDIVANGVGVKSAYSTNDANYGNMWGTSQASPAAAGSAALLVQLARQEFGVLMRSSMLKAVIIHTADDLGTSGPDYQYGWGLINTKTAADLLLKHKNDPAHPVLYEGELSGTNRSQSFTVTWDGITPLRATLCWTDPAGTARSFSTNKDRTPVLVNDLDLKVTPVGGTNVYYPYTMPFVGDWSDAAMALPSVADKPNRTDNVEQVDVPPLAPYGDYTVTVSLPEGEVLSDPPQSYSLVLTGAGSPPQIIPSVLPDTNAGAEVDRTLTASGPGPHTFLLVGSLPRGLHLDPATGKIEGVPLESGSFSFSVRASSAQGIGVDTTFTLHVAPAAVSYEQWKRAWFTGDDLQNAAISGPEATNNATGIPNLIVYATTGGDPRHAEASGAVTAAAESTGGTNFLTLTAPKFILASYDGATNATFTAQYSEDLSAPWIEEGVTILSNTPGIFKVRANIPAGEASRQFLRARIRIP